MSNQSSRPTVAELLADARSNLRDAVTPSLTSSSRSDDAYEFYLFSLIIRAAEDADATVSYENGTFRGTGTFTVRTSPGRIYSTNHPYTHAVLEWSNVPPLEAHIGVRVQGTSKVLHECDVLVLDRLEAQRCRADLRDPSSSKIVLALEAKFYASNLHLYLARQFIGWAADLSTRSTKLFVTNSTSNPVVQLLAHRTKVGHYNVEVVPDSRQSDALLAHLRWEFQQYCNTRR
jgi:hypothetical protein